MSVPTAIERALEAIATELRDRHTPFALVGGLAVSVRGEVRFTRDVDVVVVVENDVEAERLIFELREGGYRPVATVEHESRKRLATARLLAPAGVKVDLMLASSGIEREVAERATEVQMLGSRSVPVASAEELLSLKVLSMTERRLQDRIDAERLLAVNPELDLGRVRENLRLIAARGYHRDQDLEAKLDQLLGSVSRAR